MIKQVEFMGLNLTLVGTKEKIQLEKVLGCSPLTKQERMTKHD